MTYFSSGISRARFLRATGGIAGMAAVTSGGAIAQPSAAALRIGVLRRADSDRVQHQAGIDAAIRDLKVKGVVTVAGDYRIVDTASAIMTVQRMFERDDVDVLLGACDTNAALQIAHLANAHKTIYIETLAGGLEFADHPTDTGAGTYTFRLNANWAMRTDAVMNAILPTTGETPRVVIIGPSDSMTGTIYATVAAIAGSRVHPEVLVTNPQVTPVIPSLLGPNQPGNITLIVTALTGETLKVVQDHSGARVVAPIVPLQDARRLPNGTAFGSAWKPALGPDETFYLGYSAAKDVLTRFRATGRRDLHPEDFEGARIDDGKPNSRWRKSDHQAVQEVYGLRWVGGKPSFEVWTSVPADTRETPTACLHCLFESCGRGTPCTPASPKP